MFVLVLILSFWFYSDTISIEDTVLKVEITENAEIFLCGPGEVCVPAAFGPNTAETHGNYAALLAKPAVAR